MKKKKARIGAYIMLLSVLIPHIALWRLFPLKATAAENSFVHTPVELTAEEQAFVDRGEEIVIGCDADICPLLFQDEETGEAKGITVDVLNIVSETTGLRFRYALLPEGDITYQDLQAIGVDLVASVEYHSINQQVAGIAMTEPYLQTAKVFVCKKGVVLDADTDMVIAASSGSQTLSKALQDIYPNFRIDYYPSTQDALSALLAGKADAVLQNQYSLQRILAKPIYDDLQVVGAAAIGDYHCLAAVVPIGEGQSNILDENTALLLSILNKGIGGLDKEEVSFIIIKESAENVYQFTMEDFAYRYRYAIMIMAIGFLLIIFLLWQVHDLQKRREQQVATEKRAKELAVMNEKMREQEILLRDALAHAEEGSRAKTSFLFNMSHDIRTPMNAILGLTAIALKHKEEQEKMIDSLEKIDESGRKLMHLLNNALDMSRISNDKVELTESACDLLDVITRTKDILQSDIERKKLIVRIDMMEIKNRSVYCDELRMNQILFNLLSNAVKFSKPEGVITISLAQSSLGIEGSYAYELRVKDNGIGMSQDFQERIFEPFEREKSSTISKLHGMGLGMSITKSLVDLMGGTIKVVSEPDQGAEFIVCFIFKAHIDNASHAMDNTLDAVETGEIGAAGAEETGAGGMQDTGPKEVDFTDKRILVVEDIEINAEIIREILGEMGFLIDTAENGKIAVEKVQSAEPGYYDLILMDIQMPIMDGYQATREIRSLERKDLADIPIVAMTANVFEEDKRNALASGMNAHLSKPVEIDKLEETLQKFLC
ncbi:MAG: response regulator [Lachnospiraceae bacterium]|nr:response regulator [Lachnospiraceae bacterium]